MAEHINVTVHKQEVVLLHTVVWKQGAESSSGHYGSWNASHRWVNIWKCRKSDTRLYVDILIKAKCCFGPLSSVQIFILGANTSAMTSEDWASQTSCSVTQPLQTPHCSANCIRTPSHLTLRGEEWHFMTDAATLVAFTLNFGDHWSVI